MPTDKLAVVGFDGGGTKTLGRIAFIGEDGPEPSLGSAQVGAANPHSESVEDVEARLAELRDKLAALLPGGAKIAAACIGAAGVDRAEEQRLMEEIMRSIFPGIEVVVVNDAVAALAGAVGWLEGIVAISGTGSIALGARGRAKIERSGGWGHILGDEGGGYQIGLDAAKAVCRAWDGRNPAGTLLTGLVLGELGLSAPPDLLGWINDKETGKSEVAALSRLVFMAAEKGDAAAAEIIQRHAALLAELIDAAAAKLGWAPSDTIPLVLWGGNLRNSAPYREQVMRLLSPARKYESIEPRGDAAEGAMRLAWEAWRDAGEPRP